MCIYRITVSMCMCRSLFKFIWLLHLLQIKLKLQNYRNGAFMHTHTHARAQAHSRTHTHASKHARTHACTQYNKFVLSKCMCRSYLTINGDLDGKQRHMHWTNLRWQTVNHITTFLVQEHAGIFIDIIRTSRLWLFLRSISRQSCLTLLWNVGGFNSIRNFSNDILYCGIHWIINFKFDCKKIEICKFMKDNWISAKWNSSNNISDTLCTP